MFQKRCAGTSFIILGFFWVILVTGTAFSKEGADVNARNADGWTRLMEASFNGDIRTVKALLARGADVNAKDQDGWTALMLVGGVVAVEVIPESAAIRVEIAKALLARGADVNAKNKDGLTALMLASKRGHGEVVKVLKAHGANSKK
ncbi:ankyrin repeat domain-containing protein [Thermodesulfobacteriota bacterium]